MKDTPLAQPMARWKRRPYRPAPEQPGTLIEQFGVIATYLADRDPDRAAAWQRARRIVLPHARKWRAGR